MLAIAYSKRVAFLLARSKCSIIWLEKELWPFVPFAVESAFLAGRPLVVDIDDAVFHNYDEHRWSIVRYLLGMKCDSIFRKATLVTAGSSYLAKRAIDAKASWVEVVPTVVDFRDYQFPDRSPRAQFVVGWIGSPATQNLLRPVLGVLGDVLNEKGSRFVTIGSAFDVRVFEQHEEWPWSRESEARQVSQFDVGIMPVPDRPFERGKCGYKLIQYMACGIPVIASPVGANLDIVRHGENGFLAATEDEWRQALLALRANPEMRQRMGEAGRRMVRHRYSLEVTGPKMAEWLARIRADSVCRGGRG